MKAATAPNHQRIREVVKSPAVSAVAAALARQVAVQVDRIAPDLAGFRRHLHQHPELSGAEFATTGYLAKRLSVAKISYRPGTGKKGIITGLVPASGASAPAIALRADIDALPITEENRIAYRSRNHGVMHACGHDAHSAILLGTTIALHRAGPLPVAWRSIFQPAEETGCGASQRMWILPGPMACP